MKNLKNLIAALYLLSVGISLNMTGCEKSPEDGPLCRTCYADYPDGDRVSEKVCTSEAESQFGIDHGDALVICY